MIEIENKNNEEIRELLKEKLKESLNLEFELLNIIKNMENVKDDNNR